MARLVLATATTVGLAASLTACHPQRWQSRLVSVNAAGTDSAAGRSHRPQLSPDGTKVVFESTGSDFGPTDTNGEADVYVRDLTTGVTELVSVNGAGTDAGNGRSYGQWLSQDGTKVVFFSWATDLASPAPAGGNQVYVRDLVTDTTTLVSVNADGTGGADGNGVDSYRISPDGRRIVFGSYAGNLAPPFTPGVGTLYERDLAAGVTTRIAAGYFPTYSPSGDALAFFEGHDIYLRDTRTGSISLLVRSAAGSRLDTGPMFSHDGTKLAFVRWTQPDWVRSDVYVYDRVSRATSLVTVGVSGGGSNNTPSVLHGFHPTDPNRLLFSSYASNLVPNDTNGRHDLFVRNLGQRTTTRVVSNVGEGRDSRSPALATWVADGSKVAFVSGASAFGVTDTNSAADVYTLRLADGTYELVSESGAGHDAGNGASGVYRPYVEINFFNHELSVSADGTRVAFGSDARNLGPTDSDGPRDHDIYVADIVSTG